MLKRMLQAIAYGRMMTAFNAIPPRFLADMGLSDLDARKARAYEDVYGPAPIVYDGL